jgi:ABC-type uncharacterized transport system fused permease/ATPase subunit
MREESAGQQLKIKEVDTRIEQEIAALRTSIQASKATTLQFIVGTGEPVLSLLPFSSILSEIFSFSNRHVRIVNGIPSFQSIITSTNVFIIWNPGSL